MISQYFAQKLAVALTASQLFSPAGTVSPSFDAEKDYPTVVQIMNQGCAHFYELGKKESAFIREFNPETDLVEMAKANPEFTDLLSVYHLFCANKPDDSSKDTVAKVVAYYNDSVKDLPPIDQLKDLKLPQSSLALDNKGKWFADVYQQSNRRQSVALKDIPDLLQKAFIAAEDKHFYEHNGVDENGLLRAAKGGGQGSHPVGGSTITQQLIKNLVVGDKIDEARKIREMILAARLEKMLAEGKSKEYAKQKILEYYLNQIYFGRASYGVATAAQTNYGKAMKDLTLTEMAQLAASAKCPISCSPMATKGPALMNERIKYVLDQMLEDKFIPKDQYDKAVAEIPTLKFAKFQNQHSFYAEKLTEAAKAEFNIDPTESRATIHTAYNSDLQANNQFILVEGLARYEIMFHRAKFFAPEKNLKDEMQKLLQADPNLATDKTNPLWKRALNDTMMPLYDVPWTMAVILAVNGNAATVGLKDGRVMALRAWNESVLPGKLLHVNDVIYVLVHEDQAYAELRARPQVQGGLLVMENKTGRIVSMVGGFSRALTTINHTIDAPRQTGSAIKPLVYLLALQAGIQPTTYERNVPTTIPAIQKGGHSWTPANYEGYNSGVVDTNLHGGLVNSYNEVTVSLLNQIVPNNPAGSVAKMQAAIKECGLLPDPPFYPSIVLGVLDVSMLNMATCFATIANGGGKPSPHLIDSIDLDGQTYAYQDPGLKPFDSNIADAVSFFQLRTLMQDVPVHGTAAAVGANLKDLAPSGSIGDYLAVKTGTATEWHDSWMIGFTSDITVAVWVGYDNGKEEKELAAKDHNFKLYKTLGPGAQGSAVAGPIFQSVIRYSVPFYPLKPLPGPTAVVAQSVVPVRSAYGTDYIRANSQQANQYLPSSIANGSDEAPPAYGNPDGNWAYQNQQYDNRPQQQPYTYDGQRGPPQSQNFSTRLFGGGWAQPQERIGNDDYSYDRQQHSHW